jgi:hypothetical protein
LELLSGRTIPPDELLASALICGVGTINLLMSNESEIKL